jgi:hypothetical protein
MSAKHLLRGISPNIERSRAIAGLDRHSAAIGDDLNGAVPVDPPCRHTVAPETFQGFGGGVAILVPSNRDDSSLGSERIQPLITGAAAAPMMAHLQEVYPAGPSTHFGFGGKACIAREQRLKVAVLYQQHQRVLVQVFAPSCPMGVRMKESETDAVENEVLPLVALVPGDPLGGELVEKLIVEWVSHRFARLDHQSGPEAVEDGGNPTQMVRMRVGDECYREIVGPLPDEEGNHHSPSRIVMLSPRTGVDQDPASPGRP